CATDVEPVKLGGVVDIGWVYSPGQAYEPVITTTLLVSWVPANSALEHHIDRAAAHGFVVVDPDLLAINQRGRVAVHRWQLRLGRAGVGESQRQQQQA